MRKQLYTKLFTVTLLLALLVPGFGTPLLPAQAQGAFDCTTVTDGMPQAECEALVALYNATDGPNWTAKTGWLETNTPCSWYGVTCAPNNVTQLWLSYNNLSGTLPTQIGNLTALTQLGLSNNQLSGPIPTQIGNLTALTQLDLSNNQLNDPIPTQIGSLTALTSLNLGNNQLTNLPGQIGNLTALTSLNLDNNQLTNLPTTIGNLGDLLNLSLSNNQLTSLPDTIGVLSKLSWLSLSRNMLTNLPAAIGNLVALWYLHLDGNQLAALPDIGGLTVLSELYLHDNPLSGEMPGFLTGLTALGQDTWYPGSPFTFYNTGWCVPATGPVPTWLSGIEHEGTGVVCGQPLGGISGHVTLTDTTPIAGIQVHLYRALAGPEFHEEFTPWLAVSRTLTIADGSYQFGGLGQGIDYRVRFVDTTDQYTSQYYNNAFLKAGATSVTVTLGAVRTGINAILNTPQPPASMVDPGSGTVTYNPDGTANIQQFRGTVSPITVTRSITCSGGITPTNVQLLLVNTWGDLISAHPMDAIETGLYRGTIPANAIQTATLDVAYTCNGDTTQTTLGYITLYDPSGIISDARSSDPIVGARVTLYYVPGWMPRTGPTDTRPNTCESNLSKASGASWSQPAPVAVGMIANPENPAIAPAISYQETNAIGYYGWDVSEGCWYVQVKAEGYATLVSPVVGVPPEVTDLDLALTPITRIYLPLVLRGH